MRTLAGGEPKTSATDEDLPKPWLSLSTGGGLIAGIGLAGYLLLSWHLGWWPILVLAAVLMLSAFNWAVERDEHGVAPSVFVTNRAKPGAHARLLVMVRQISGAAGIDRPTVFVAHEHEPHPRRRHHNAWAARGRTWSELVVTDRAIRDLSDSQLRGLLAHEVAHLRSGGPTNRVLQCLWASAATVSVLSLAALTVRSLLNWEGSHTAAAWLSGLAFSLLTATVARLVTSAGRRSLEYGADKGGAWLSSPSAVSDSLNGTHLIACPDGAWRTPTVGEQLFASHPSVQRRIRRMQALHASQTGVLVEFPTPAKSQNVGPTGVAGFVAGAKNGYEHAETGQPFPEDIEPPPPAIRALFTLVSTAVVVTAAYSSWMALAWLSMPPAGDWSLPLAALFAAASPATFQIWSWLRRRWVIRSGPAWDRWGQPARPGRRRDGMAPLHVGSLLLPLAALVAAGAAGLPLWEPVLMLWVAARVAIQEVERWSARLSGRSPLPMFSQAARRRNAALRVGSLVVGLGIVAMIFTGHEGGAMALAVTGLVTELAIHVALPIRPLRPGEADGTPGGPAPEHYTPVPDGPVAV